MKRFFYFLLSEGNLWQLDCIYWQVRNIPNTCTIQLRLFLKKMSHHNFTIFFQVQIVLFWCSKQAQVNSGENTEINKQSHVKFWLNWIKYGAVSYSLAVPKYKPKLFSVYYFLVLKVVKSQRVLSFFAFSLEFQKFFSQKVWTILIQNTIVYLYGFFNCMSSVNHVVNHDNPATRYRSG